VKIRLAELNNQVQVASAGWNYAWRANLFGSVVFHQNVVRFWSALTSQLLASPSHA